MAPPPPTPPTPPTSWTSRSPAERWNGLARSRGRRSLSVLGPRTDHAGTWSSAQLLQTDHTPRVCEQKSGWGKMGMIPAGSSHPYAPLSCTTPGTYPRRGGTRQSRQSTTTWWTPSAGRCGRWPRRENGYFINDERTAASRWLLISSILTILYLSYFYQWIKITYLKTFLYCFHIWNVTHFVSVRVSRTFKYWLHCIYILPPSMVVMLWSASIAWLDLLGSTASSAGSFLSGIFGYCSLTSWSSC